jgi:hypothetical protein
VNQVLPTGIDRAPSARAGEVEATDGEGWATCPHCGGRGVRTVDTRNHARLPHVRRRRKACPSCQWRWTTLEVPVAELNAVADYSIRLVSLAEALREVLPGAAPPLLDKLVDDS